MKVSFFNKTKISETEINLEHSTDIENILTGEWDVTSLCQDILTMTNSKLCAIIVSNVFSTKKTVHSSASQRPSMSNEKPFDQRRLYVSKTTSSDQRRHSMVSEKPFDQRRYSMASERPSDQRRHSIVGERPFDQKRHSIVGERPFDQRSMVSERQSKSERPSDQRRQSMVSEKPTPQMDCCSNESRRSSDVCPFNIIYSTDPTISFCQDMPLLMINHEIVICNSVTNDPRNANYNSENCPLEKMCTIPIFKNEIFYGKIILANRRKGYSPKTLLLIEKQISLISSMIISKDDNIIFGNVGKNSRDLNFLSSIAHEIKTPVHGIVNMISLIPNAGDLNDKQRKYISLALSSCEDLIKTVSDSIDYQKIKNNSLGIENDSFNIRELIDKTINLVKFKADQKGLKMDLIIGKNVPTIVYGDATRIGQVLINLIGNAIKFTSKGGITIKLDQYPSRIIFTIADTGCGIRKENLQQIFTEYFQEEKYSLTGMGLGLSLSKKLIQMMGGGISVVSTYGFGTTFTVDLPLSEERYFLDISSDDDKEVSVLIVDPVETNRITLRKYLKQWKINVDTAASFKEGKKILTDDDYDIFMINPNHNIGDAFSFCHFVEDKLPTSRIICIGEFEENTVFDGYIGNISNKEDVYNIILSVKKRKKPIEISKNISEYRVCIVEDDEISAYALKEIMLTKGIQEKNIVIIDNGEQAIRDITHAYYDIIFMDCRLKGDMNGIKVTQILKEMANLKIIGMTASITEDEKSLWLNSGLQGLIIKPFSADAIYKLL